MLKNKRIVLVVGAIVFLGVIFLVKNNSSYQSKGIDAGLVYGNLSVEDLVDTDTDGDGVPDWEEGLWGTDPTKKDTNDDGVSDSVEIQKLKRARGVDFASLDGQAYAEENLTQTDKFSRELFSTVAALNQTGAMDDSTVDKLTDSLANQIGNSSPRKIFLLSDIKIIKDSSATAYKNYNDALNVLVTKYPPQGNALAVLQEFLNDGEDVNTEALSKLNPIIKQSQEFANGMTTIQVPSELAQLHLNVINSLWRLTENLNDMQLFETDPIVAMGGMGKFEDNNNLLQENIQKLTSAMGQKINN